MIRVGIVGGGIAGSLLAWRLAASHPGWSVTLIAPAARSDATEASGGLVRAFEPAPENCRLATESLAELRGSPLLSAWADYQETPSVYICDQAPRAMVAELVAGIERRLPGYARVLRPPELEAVGWRGLPSDALGVVEPRAGNISPARLRRAVTAALPRLGVEIVEAAAERVEPLPGGGATCHVGRRRSSHDVVVIAGGRWTPSLLRSSGMDSGGFRTKLIQYGLFEARGWRPPVFVDDSSGLYGRPAGNGRVLLGVPVQEWDVDPDRQGPSDRAVTHTREMAAARFPRMELGRLTTLVTAADCYAEPPTLALRPVEDGRADVYTFTGGSGGAAKTALAASATAADQVARELSGART